MLRNRFLAIVLLAGWSPPATVDLVIAPASVFDARSRRVLPNRTITVARGVIVEAATGIPMADVLAIATLGTATAIGADDVMGTIEPGKRANLVLWDRSPLDDPANVWATKTVITNGQVYAMDGAPR